MDKYDIASQGADHYKTGGVELLDLLRDIDLLTEFIRGSIIKYAARWEHGTIEQRKKDARKIEHYAQMLWNIADHHNWREDCREV